MDNIQKTNKHKVRTFDLIMILAVTASGALFFLCITRSISGMALLNPWISAMICAVVFEVLLSIFAITVGVKKMIAPIVVIAFLPSIIFVPIVMHMIIVVIAMLIAIKGLLVMRHTLFNFLKIDIGTIIRSGIVYLSFALIMVITSQYYFFIKQNEVVMFDAGNYVKTSNLLIDQILKTSNVENISINTMTVDDFLVFVMEKVNDQQSVQGPVINEENEGMVVRWAQQAGVNIEQIEQNAQDQALDQMLVNISEMTGREVQGDELISDIFSEIISTQVNNIINKNEFLRKNKINIFTAIFFLIIFSLASLVKIATGWGARFIFMIFRESGIIKVTKTKRDAEIIVL